MSREIYVRPVRPDDFEKFAKWSAETKDNLFDPDVIGYNGTFILCAFDQSGPLLYMPIQQPFFLESLAIRPGAKPGEVGLAMKEILQAAVTQAFVKQAGEIYFVCKDESTITISKDHFGFEEMPWRVLRLMTKNLTKGVVQ